MEFRTKITIPESPNKICYKSNLFFIGSCFAENIGSKVVANKFNAVSNPFGVLYNPASVRNSLNRIIKNTTFSEKDFFKSNELYKSFDLHSSFADIDLNKIITRANETLNYSHKALINADFLFITLGTSWIYDHAGSNKTVANCHKLPEKTFKRRLLKHDEIVNYLNDVQQSISSINSKVNIVLSVSPVRHLKDGAIGNQLSKSLLFTAINEVLVANNNYFYFPAYEIMMDELRDYRFYASDMIHPSDTAVDYIWTCFKNSFMNEETIKLSNRITNIVTAQNHKPFFKNTTDYNNFITKLNESIQKLKEDYPYILL